MTQHIYHDTPPYVFIGIHALKVGVLRFVKQINVRDFCCDPLKSHKYLRVVPASLCIRSGDLACFNCLRKIRKRTEKASSRGYGGIRCWANAAP